MPSKTITVSTEKWERVKPSFWDSVPRDADGQPEYTESEWVFESLKRVVARRVRSYELKKQGSDNAPAYDDDMMTVT